MSSPNRCGSADSGCTRCGSGWSELNETFSDQELPSKRQRVALPSIGPFPDFPFYSVGPASPVDNLPSDDSSSGYTIPANNLPEDSSVIISGYTTPPTREMSEEEKKTLSCAPDRMRTQRSEEVS